MFPRIKNDNMLRYLIHDRYIKETAEKKYKLEKFSKIGEINNLLYNSSEKKTDKYVYKYFVYKSFELNFYVD